MLFYVTTGHPTVGTFPMNSNTFSWSTNNALNKYRGGEPIMVAKRGM